ncbi:MAG: hypothetical protein IAF02_13660 [Anaerolineae bacterium]|nr:hypothetical protein [Anaerolineae bacterium]
MSTEFNTLILESFPSQKDANELMDKMFEAAKPSSIFSEPVVHGEYAVITASETIAGLGYGYGGGGGVDGSSEGEAGESGTGSYGSGGGGGGGGSILGRPVAVISVGPDGVHVEPIMDPTKIAIAFLTTTAAIFMSMRRIWKMK